MVPSESTGVLVRRLLQLEDGEFSDADVLGKYRQMLEESVNGMPAIGMDRRVQFLISSFFRELQIVFASTQPSRNFTMGWVCCTRSGNCLGLSTLFYSLAVDLGLPVVPILFEGHIACGVIGSDCLAHIELTRAGAALPPKMIDSVFGTKRGLAITTDQLVAVHFSNRAVHRLLPTSRVDEAMNALDCSIELFPNYAAARINRAMLLLDLGEIDKSVKEIADIRRLDLGKRCKRALDVLDGRLATRIRFSAILRRKLHPTPP